MMKNRRGFLETLRDYLDAMETYPKPTRIMQLANLSRPALLGLIDYSIKNGMVETYQKGARHFYRMTYWGRFIRDSLKMVPESTPVSIMTVQEAFRRPPVKEDIPAGSA
jgi:predicted transcriptional regulator